MNFFLVLLISIGFLHNSCFSQDYTNFFPSYKKQIIKSKIHNIEKEIIIGLPDNFNDSSTYPVVFVLEGELLFETLAPLTKLMAKMGEIPPCVVVGIPFFNQHLAYAPKIEGIPESGNADSMLDFYRSELFPFLEDEYQCTNERIIWAHSGLGGIFCTYLLLGPDDQFSGVLSSSPNLKWMQQYITKDDAFILTSKKNDLFYYLTFGSEEGEDYMEDIYKFVQNFKDKLELDSPDNLNWHYRFYKKNNHFTNAIETYIDGLILYFNSNNAKLR